jgi:hypothetical protein
MLLTSFVALTSLGFVLWAAGHFSEYTGVAAIGAVLVIAVGGGVVLTDLHVKTGETVDRSYTTVNNSTVVDTVSRSNVYERVVLLDELGGQAGPLSLGGLLMLTGAVLMMRRLEET